MLFTGIVTTVFFRADRRLFNKNARELMITSYDITLDVINENVCGIDFKHMVIKYQKKEIAITHFFYQTRRENERK